MKLQIVFLLLITMFSTCRADDPGQFPLDPPNPAAFARAVNGYISLGERRAIYLLSKRIRNDGFSASLLCLVLFEPKLGHEMRAPMWG